MSGMYKSFIYLLYEHRRVQPGLFLMRVQPAVRTSAAVSLISSGTLAVGALALVNAVSGGLWAGGRLSLDRQGRCFCVSAEHLGPSRQSPSSGKSSLRRPCLCI